MDQYGKPKARALTGMSWTGGTKFKSYITMPHVLTVLSRAKAPAEVIQQFISYIEKQELRLFCAKKFKCHPIALEILKKSKDRKGLMEYISHLPPTSAEYRSAFAALHQSGVNWRN